MEEDRYKEIDSDEYLVVPKPVDNHEVSNKENVHDFSKSGSTVDQYHEETSAEIASPPRWSQTNLNTYNDEKVGTTGTVIGVISLIVSILSLFMLPFLFGVIGIIGGFVSRSQGAKSLGSWAIGISIVSIVVKIFIAPFF